MAEFTSPNKPTMYFIGVTTKGSSINRVFPLWAKILRLPDCQLVGIDFKLHDDPARYREAVEFIKRDPMSLGALVTTHKIDLFTACRDLFDAVEPLSARMGEVSSIYKRAGKLHARAADPWTAGYALDAFLPQDHWRGGGEALILGAGGSAVALAWRLCKPELSANRPKQIHVANRSVPRLDHLQQLYASWNVSTKLQCHHVPSPEMADAIVRRLPPGSMVVNATGLGKDAPGSPITDAAVFPDRGIAWEFNYRGDLLFLRQARAQEDSRKLHVEDGWIYFIHGWSRVIADVFSVDLPPKGTVFDELSRVATAAR
jgi:shikimate 5-dehydrogenase